MPMLGDVFLNTVYEENPDRSVKTTDHPIEGGVDITDHVERKPITMDIEGVIIGPDAAMRMKRLNEYMDNGEPLKYVYRNTMANVIIEDFGRSHNKEVANGFAFDITLKQIRIAKPSIIKSLATPTKVQVAKTENKGQQQASGSTPTKVYVVKSGDTLSAIGRKYNMSYTKIHDKNRGVIGDDPNLIYPGQKLIIPA